MHRRERERCKLCTYFVSVCFRSPAIVCVCLSLCLCV
uniref:GH22170p n=1 Tax=Drosophila melanogaster TaxID=7227 RepID=Q95T48_DROME|nr:GH22170p [Drosophila melanogaster]